MKLFLIFIGFYWTIGLISLFFLSFEDFRRDISFRDGGVINVKDKNI